MEYKLIRVQRFRSPDGLPTCCANHDAGETCRYLGVRKFGTVDVCMLGEQRDLSERTMAFQRPDARCEVWADDPPQALDDSQQRMRAVLADCRNHLACNAVTADLAALYERVAEVLAVVAPTQRNTNADD